ncbi:Retrovirus-related Pol polyprotein from transposon TNT 1-94 [Vitis vinifera]|uniref:Retrovirus-related Pol polyprotein from transposon TNT 1-94 n=1 Tax=Vitis vinifera TaxID=29760 RepID=A0A438JKL5_VITVI|nr:Retrovirus-related Pol polyprotein from transposon TNT 1-94 [Vitis vinifera]
MDSRTVSCYFVGYSERSRGFKFYDPSTRSFFETDNAKFIEDVELSEREPLRNVVFEEESVSIPIIATGHGHIMFDDTIQNVQPITEIVNTIEILPTQVVEPVQIHEEITQQPQEPQVQVPLRRSTRERRSTILDDYVVYLQEHEFDMAMKDEMKSMKDNGVWDLVELPEGVKPIGCKWIFKTKWDSKGNIVKYKARLAVKGFTQKEGIDYKETFSPVSSKDSFRIIMALMADYDLELHQMDVKTVFLNGNIDETIYMVQPKNFESNDSKQLIYMDHSRSILGLSQKSYIDKVLSRLGMSNCAPGDTFPYVQVCTRPKIAYIVGMLGRYLSNPGMDHWNKAKRVMWYLQITKDYMLTYRRSNHLEIVGYSDSDFMGYLDNRRSTLGYIFMLAGGAVSGKSVKQTLIASSTMEVEFIACYEASNHGIWLWNFITQL